MSYRSLSSALALGAALILAGCSEEAPEAKKPRPIKSVVAQIQPVGETIVQTGQVRPREETPISFRIGGQLTFRVENGSVVKAGDLLASIDKTPPTNAVLTATADLATARANLVLAETTAVRNRDLFAKNVASKAQLQEAEANLQTAQARLEAAQAALSNAQETLSYTEIRAVRDGIISAVGANQAQVIDAGQMVVTLMSNDQRDAVFDVPERLLARKTEAPLVDVSLISDPSITAKGRVREVTPSADPVTRTFRIKASLDAGGKAMPFGAAILGQIVLSPKDLFTLPASALTKRDGKPAVFVYDPATQKLALREVQLDRFDDTNLYISGGLNNGDVVATAGVSKLRDGEAVILEAGR